MKKYLSLLLLFSTVNFSFSNTNNKFFVKFGLSMDYLFLNSKNMQIHKQYQIQDISLKFHHFSFHPIVGLNYTLSSNFSLGIETGLIAVTNMIHGSKEIYYTIKTVKDVYVAGQKYFSIPMFFDLRYKFDVGFNIFSKFGVSFTQISEKLSVEQINTQNNKSISYNEFPIIKTTSFLPITVLGVGYEIKNMVNVFTQYSYTHGNSKISSIQSIGLGIELKLPI